MGTTGDVVGQTEAEGRGLRSVTYVSSAASQLTGAELLAMLEHIRPRNAELGLSGMLLYSGGNIIQVLEGPADAVERTFALISRDLRHRDVIVLLDDAIETRTFPEWTMGFRDVSPGADAVRPVEADAVGLNDVMSGGKVGDGVLVSDEPDTVRLLELFRRNMR